MEELIGQWTITTQKFQGIKLTILWISFQQSNVVEIQAVQNL
jgi:hypothetical protein